MYFSAGPNAEEKHLLYYGNIISIIGIPILGDSILEHTILTNRNKLGGEMDFVLCANNNR